MCISWYNSPEIPGPSQLVVEYSGNPITNLKFTCMGQPLMESTSITQMLQCWSWYITSHLQGDDTFIAMRYK